MAMSIEGYIANVKKNIRVSPATTIKNLSHSPYIYEDINHRVNAGRFFFRHVSVHYVAVGHVLTSLIHLIFIFSSRSQCQRKK